MTSKITTPVEIGPYTILEKIGQGSFGAVVKVQHRPTGTHWALKAVARKKDDHVGMERLARETHILKRTHHPNIVALSKTLESKNHTYLVMELMTGGDLSQALEKSGTLDRGEGVPKRKGFPEATVRLWMKQLISGLRHCRNLSIAHRDLKPPNLLLDANRNLKIADFGLANVQPPDCCLTTAVGSLNYAAPELLKNADEASPSYDGFSVDIWSCGVIMYELLVGSRPFDDPQQIVVWNNIRANVRKPWPETYAISEEAKHLVGCMLELDPIKRIDVERILEHPWFGDLPLPAKSE